MKKTHKKLGAKSAKTKDVPDHMEVETETSGLIRIGLIPENSIDISGTPESLQLTAFYKQSFNKRKF